MAVPFHLQLSIACICIGSDEAVTEITSTYLSSVGTTAFPCFYNQVQITDNIPTLEVFLKDPLAKVLMVIDIACLFSQDYITGTLSCWYVRNFCI